MNKSKGLYLNNDKLEYFNKINSDFTALYVEDNDVLRKQTMKMLKSILPNIIECTNGTEGINLYNKYKNSDELKDFDLIITDIQMPYKNGLEMISNIRDLDIKIPIIIFSAYDKSDYFLEAIKIGINGYILKPYSLEQIADVLIDCINKYNKENLIVLENGYIWSEFEGTLKNDKEVVKLSKNEIKLMDYLLSSNRSIKSSESIENYIFDDFISNNKRIRSLISRFNSKFEENIIESIYSEGYRLKLSSQKT